MHSVIETIVGVPGRWKNKSEIVTAVASKSDGYILAGEHLINSKTKDTYTVEIYERDENLSQSFMHAGNFTDEQLKEIDDHNLTIYLIGESGDLRSLTNINYAVSGLLKAGGLAVKIESSGVAHTSERWLEFTKSEDIVEIFHGYVTLLADDHTYYSCGMHNLGYPDAIITTDMSAEDAGYLLTTFLIYLLTENNILQQGDTFQLSPSSSVYSLKHEECGMYSQDDLFYNPFGYWRLNLT
ncbi:DUF4261 domain-containing protein [Brevibacillus dissolubilis]|uniref:DUF4261 domain-containing protein n=1 Tax=Brevibacillus dissolubilis TaxID=1844116 RepID=UPI0011179784|nr:DUF4261 domain-containing protein [Brevibacillus dissolubilis]